MIGTTATMPPAIDRSTPRACMICKAVKAPDAFKSARKCVDCEARVAGDAAAAYRLANRPAGAKSTVADFLEDQWTLTECKERREIKQPYLKLSDLSPAFLGDVEPPVIDAKITDADGRVAHKMACKTSVSFCPIPWCMAHAGYKMCTKCTHVRPLADFNRQGMACSCAGTAATASTASARPGASTTAPRAALRPRRARRGCASARAAERRAF